MNLIGLTGGVGMGKSTAAKLFEDRGIPAIDTDLLAREVVQPGTPALEEIRHVFGPSVFAPDGQLRREELARLVFSNETRRAELEAIVHPRIRERWLAQAEMWRAAQKPLGMVIIPLLLETNAAAAFNTIVCVACSAATQRQRLMARGWSDDQINQRIAAQWPVEKKINRSHYVLWTEGGLDVLEAQVDAIFRKLQFLS